MGERRKEALRVGFDGGLKLTFGGSRVTSDAGLVAFRDPDDALALTAMADDLLEDQRTGNNSMRHKYRTLTDEEKALMELVKDKEIGRASCRERVFRTV